MTRFKRTLPALLAALVLVAACGADDGGEGTTSSTPAAQTGTLTVYSGRSDDLIQPMLDRFTDETGIEVEVRYGDSADLALLIDTEGDKSPADVFISQSPGAVGFLEGNDRLADIDGDTTAMVAESNRSSANKWVGLSGRVRVLVYNTDLVDEADLPDSVLDMTNDMFAGKVGVAPTNGSFQDFVTGMRVELGDEVAAQWLDGMAANDSPPYPKNGAIVEAVGRGEIPMGLVNHYYLYLALAENPDLPIANHFFAAGDIGSLLIVTGGAIVKNTDQLDASQQLMAFLLGEEAQRFFAEDEFEYPLASGVKPSGGVPPLDELPQTAIDLDELGGGLARTAELIQDSGLDAS
jgi:iron(III) transport system substrate-binding protein